MTAKELADMLNGGEYGREITREEERLARENGLVVVFGYSDDNIEFRGAIDYETGSYGGGTVLLNRDGVIDCPDCGMGGECKLFRAAKKECKEIKAVWCAEGKAPWNYETEIPHEEFNIYEDGELFCVGIVFSMDSLRVEVEK